jgi:imidazolonepropionase-like amidohydrolase
VGTFADLIVVEGDPLKDITVLTKASNVSLIVRDGVVVKNSLVMRK